MSLEECLKIYNTDKVEDSILLDTIWRNVHNSFYGGSINKYKIEKILIAFNNIESILRKFEMEHEKGLFNIKKYILGCKLDKNISRNIENIMIEWGIFYKNIGFESSIKKLLIERYREEFNLSVKCKKSFLKFKYLEYLLLIRALKEASKEKQLEIVEKLKNDDKESADNFMDFLLKSEVASFSKNQSLVINENYITKLSKEEFLLKFIKMTLEGNFDKYNYSNYEEDLKKILLVQKDVNYWIDMTKLDSLIDVENINLLTKFHLINNYRYKNRQLVKITELGLSIVKNHFIDSWDSNKYFSEYENKIIVAFDDNPLLICKYLFDENYNLKGDDFLFIFDKKNK